MKHGLAGSYTQPATLLESALWDEAVVCGSALESSVEESALGMKQLCVEVLLSPMLKSGTSFVSTGWGVFSKMNMHLGSPDSPAVEQAVLFGH